MDRNTDFNSPTFRLIALMIVGSVAKALFAPPRPTVYQTVNAAKDETVPGTVESSSTES